MDWSLIETVLLEALGLSVLLSAVPLIASMITGVFASILQAATQVQEQTLSFVPKIASVCVILYFLGPWLSAQIYQFSVGIFDVIVVVGRGM